MPLFLEQLEQGNRVTFGPKGTSMLPMLRQKLDRVELASLTRDLRKYDLPLYRRKNGHYVLHRIVKTGHTYTCIGDNQFTRETGVEREQVIAVATGFYRGEKYIPVTALSYRLYCRFWHWTRGIRFCWRKIKARAQGVPNRK